MRGQVGMISSSFSGTCLLLHHTVADEITHVVKTWASCVIKQLLKSKFGPENICRNSAGYANPISQRSIQWPSFLCIMVCADFPLFLPKVSHKRCFHTQPLTHFVSPNFVPTNIDPYHQQIWGVHIPSLKLPLWDLDLFPLLFLAVWSPPLLANFLFSTVAAVAGLHSVGSTHKVPHRRLSLGEGLDLFSSQPPASQRHLLEAHHHRTVHHQVISILQPMGSNFQDRIVLKGSLFQGNHILWQQIIPKKTVQSKVTAITWKSAGQCVWQSDRVYVCTGYPGICTGDI